MVYDYSQFVICPTRLYPARAGRFSSCCYAHRCSFFSDALWCSLGFLVLSLMVLSALERSLNALKQRFDSKKIQRSWYFHCKTRLLQQPLRKAKRLSSAVSISKIENHLSLLFLTALLRVFVSVERDVRDKQSV